ncbi:MAG TPA: ribosome silencing factor [Alphaproteobacteria bacterium]|nr:ribosome silencing factor [Alphaproteobacteria bacterium]
MTQASLNSKDLSERVTQILEDKKAQDLLVLDVKNRSSIADFMVIASGTSGRQLAAMAVSLKSDLKSHVFSIEGLSTCDWVLVDLGDVLVHLFKPEVRAFYNLEKMWEA